jgi:hypothetical protein
MQAQWEEVGSMKDRPLDVDVDKFTALQSAGMLLCCAARDGDVVVGYTVDLVQSHLHYKTTLISQADSYYIVKEYRARCAMGLTRFVEKVSREMGITSRITRTKNTNKAGDFFKAMGYVETEVAWMKRL